VADDRSSTVLKSDKQLRWLPVISAIFCLAATVIIFSAARLVVVPLGSIPHDPSQQKLLGFLFYLVNYGIAIFFNLALVSIASNRLVGSHATLNTSWEFVAVNAAAAAIFYRIARLSWIYFEHPLLRRGHEFKY